MSRIYGIDNGNLRRVNEINNLSEIDLFFKIDSYLTYILKLKEENYDVTEELYALEYLVYQTKKFGVELDEPMEGKFIIPNNSFKEWYSYYKQYLSKMSQDDNENLRLSRLNNKNISSYIPNKTWKENNDTSVKLTIILKKGE